MKTDFAARVGTTRSLRDYRSYLSLEDGHSFQMLAGLVSIFSGIFVAGMVLFSLPVNLSSFEKAHELGIISQTIIEGYPKALEMRYYVLGVVTSVISGLLIFLGITYLHYRRKGVGPLVNRTS